jgi:CO/xanthine dehydrogenase Mo-binding subunit
MSLWSPFLTRNLARRQKRRCCIQNWAIMKCPILFSGTRHQYCQPFQDPQRRCGSAWPKCAAIVEHTFRIPHVQHVPIEPHVAIAKVEENGKVTLWAASQSPFAQRNLIAKALDKSESDVRVIAPYVGGGFGCKAGVTMEAMPVAIATKTKGRPVKLLLTREEEFYTNFVRQGLVIKLKVGCDEQGRLLALENTMYWDGGASTEYGVNITRAGGYSSTGPV